MHLLGQRSCGSIQKKNKRKIQMSAGVVLVIDTTGGNAIYDGQDLGAAVVVASNIEEARRFIDVFKPTLVIMDPIADRREGLFLFKRLVSLRIPVIVQTMDDPVTYLKAGALHVLQKPLNREACRVAVKNWLEVISSHQGGKPVVTEPFAPPTSAQLHFL